MGRKLSRDKIQIDEIGNRKSDHIRICLEEKVQAKSKTTGFEDVALLHRALPETNLKEIDLATSFFKHKFSAPIIVESMTGGTEQAFEINAAIAQAVEELGIGMGVGSQRVALEDPRLERTFSITRKKAPSAFIVANIGAPQIKEEYNIKIARKAVEMIEADALFVHLNPLQEAIQPEGETNYARILEKIKAIAEASDVPIIAKETGAGIAANDAKRLKEAAISGIDIAGAGGTSWAAVEYHRAIKRGDFLGQNVGKDFWDWGIPTVVSLIETTQSVDLPVIASGGIRSGKDVAKSLALGAQLAGFALPILESAHRSAEKVKEKLTIIVHQLRTGMFLVGANSVKNLQSVPVVITGKTAEWLRTRGFDPEIYARRGG